LHPDGALFDRQRAPLLDPKIAEPGTRRVAQRKVVLNHGSIADLNISSTGESRIQTRRTIGAVSLTEHRKRISSHVRRRVLPSIRVIPLATCSAHPHDRIDGLRRKRANSTGDNSVEDGSNDRHDKQHPTHETFPLLLKN
jgi:hypothetical protein